MLLLESGGYFDPYRPRSAGVLNGEELALCKAFKIPLGYDCAQIGWVALTCEDDLFPASETEEIIHRQRARLGRELAEFIRQVADGRITVESARQQAFDTVAELCATSGLGCHITELDNCYLALQQEVVRFLRGLPHVEDNEDVPSFHYRRWSDDDAEAYRRILGNPNVWIHMPEDAPEEMSVETATSLITVANAGDHHEVLAVLRDEEIVGQVRLLFNQHYAGLRGAEVAYLLGEEHWGQGLMSGILHDFTRLSLRDHSLDFICAWIRPDNVASLKCAERSGYLRDQFSHEDKLAAAVGREGFQRYTCFALDAVAA